jgi:hypothetical protein
MRVRPDLQGREQTTVGIVMPYLAGAHGRLRPSGSFFGSSDYSHTQWTAKVRWSSTLARLPCLLTEQGYPEDSSRRHLCIIADLSSRLKAKRISLNQVACESVQCYLRCRPRYSSATRNVLSKSFGSKLCRYERWSTTRRYRIFGRFCDSRPARPRLPSTRHTCRYAAGGIAIRRDGCR